MKFWCFIGTLLTASTLVGARAASDLRRKQMREVA